MKRFDPYLDTGFYGEKSAIMEEDNQGDYINYFDTKKKLEAILQKKDPKCIACALEEFFKEFV